MSWRLSLKTWLFLFALLSISAQAENKFKYKTFFGNCPAKSAGRLTLKLIQRMEEGEGLRSLKNFIEENELEQRHFLSKYNVELEPMRKHVKFEFDCPVPMFEVSVKKKKGKKSYKAILVENGELLDLTYEVLLRSEGKLSGPLPSLVMGIDKVDKKSQIQISQLFRERSLELRSKLSEVILNENDQMTVILSVKRRPSSVFLGKDDWRAKLEKLERLVDQLSKRKKFPRVINLTSSKKIVVKFADKF